MGDGLTSTSTSAAAGCGSARAMGFVAANAFARMSGALPKDSRASQVAATVTATNPVASIPQPRAVRPRATKRNFRRGGGGTKTAKDEMSPKVSIA